MKFTIRHDNHHLAPTWAEKMVFQRKHPVPYGKIRVWST
jgi:hypothetical protein